MVSESAATCWANHVANSKLGYIKLDSKTVSAFWGDPALGFTSTSLGAHIPVLERKLGKNKPLTGYIKFKDVEVIFGAFDADVIFSYTACYQLNIEEGHGSKSQTVEVIYDEVQMVTSAKVSSENDLLNVTLL